MKSRIKPFQQFNLTNRLIPNNDNNSQISSSVQISSASSSSSRYQIPKYIYPQPSNSLPNNNNTTSYSQEQGVSNSNIRIVSKIQTNQPRDYRFKVINGTKNSLSNINTITNTPHIHTTNSALSNNNNNNISTPYIKNQYIQSNIQTASCKQLSPLRSQPKYQTPKLYTYRSTTPQVNNNIDKNNNDKNNVDKNNSSINFHTQIHTQANIKRQNIMNTSNISINTCPPLNYRQLSQTRIQNNNQSDNIFNYFNGVKKQYKDKQRYQYSAPQQQNQAEFSKIVNKIKGNRDKNNQVFQSNDTIQSQQVSINSFNTYNISRETSPNQKNIIGKVFQKPVTTTSNFCYYNAVSQPNGSIYTSQINNDQFSQLQKKNQQLSTKIKILQIQISSFKNTIKQWAVLEKNYKQEIQKTKVQSSQLLCEKNYLSQQLSKKITAQSQQHHTNMKLKQQIMELNKKLLQTKSQYYRTVQQLKVKHQNGIQQLQKSALALAEKSKESQLKNIMDIKNQLDRHISNNIQLEKKLEQEQKKNIDRIYANESNLRRLSQQHFKQTQKLVEELNQSKSNWQILNKQIMERQDEIIELKKEFQIKISESAQIIKNLYNQKKALRQQIAIKLKKNVQEQTFNIKGQFRQKYDKDIKLMDQKFKQEISKRQMLIKQLNYEKQALKSQLQSKIKQLKDQKKEKQNSQANYQAKLSKIIKEKYEIQLKAAKQTSDHLNVLNNNNYQILRLKESLQLIQFQGEQKNAQIQEIYTNKINQLQKQKDQITNISINDNKTMEKIHQQNVILKQKIEINRNAESKLKQVQLQFQTEQQKQIQQVRTFQNQIKIKQQQILAEKQKVYQMTNEINNLKNKQQQLCRQNGQLRHDCQIMNQQIQNLLNNQNLLRSDLSKLNNSTQQLQHHIEHLNIRIIDLTQKQVSNQAEKQTLKKVTIQLNIMKDNYEKQMIAMNEQYNNCLRQLQSHLNCQNQQIRFIQKTKDDLRAQKQQLAEINSNLIHQIQIFKSQNQKLRNSITVQLKQIQDLNNINQKLTEVSQQVNEQIQFNNNQELSYIKNKVNQNQKLLDIILQKNQSQNQNEQMLAQFERNSTQLKIIINKLQSQNNQLLELLKNNKITFSTQNYRNRSHQSLNQMIDCLYLSAIQKLQSQFINQFHNKISGKLNILEQKIIQLQQNKVKTKQSLKQSDDWKEQIVTQNKLISQIRSFYEGKYKQIWNIFNQETDTSSQNNLCSLPSIQQFADKQFISNAEIQSNTFSIQENETRTQEQFTQKHKKLLNMLGSLVNKMEELHTTNGQLEQQCNKQKIQKTKILEQKNKIKNQNTKLAQNLVLAEQNIRRQQEEIGFKNNTIEVGQAKLRQLQYVITRQEQLAIPVIEDLLAIKLNILNSKYAHLAQQNIEQQKIGQRIIIQNVVKVE